MADEFLREKLQTFVLIIYLVDHKLFMFSGNSLYIFLRWNHGMLDFLNNSMYTTMPVLMYARIHSYIERCMLHIHDFYIYYGLLHSLFPCMQSKEIIANFIVIYQMSDCIVCIKVSIACMHAYQEIEHRVISSLHSSQYLFDVTSNCLILSSLKIAK